MTRENSCFNSCLGGSYLSSGVLSANSSIVTSNMEAARFFLKVPSPTPLYLLSEWLPISLAPDPAAQLCSLHLYTDGRLYTTPQPVQAAACNAQIQGNVLQLLREACSTHKDKYDFVFHAEEMDATLEIRMAVGATRNSYLRLIAMQLERVFMDDPLSLFLTNVERMSMFITVTEYVGRNSSKR